MCVWNLSIFVSTLNESKEQARVRSDNMLRPWLSLGGGTKIFWGDMNYLQVILAVVGYEITGKKFTKGYTIIFHPPTFDRNLGPKPQFWQNPTKNHNFSRNLEFLVWPLLN